jgi:hypothetical protein
MPDTDVTDCFQHSQPSDFTLYMAIVMAETQLYALNRVCSIIWQHVCKALTIPARQRLPDTLSNLTNQSAALEKFCFHIQPYGLHDLSLAIQPLNGKRGLRRE